jgi:hypothetical protein
LTAAVHALGTSNWPAIAAKISGRTPRQCRERWNNYANPGLNKESWTDADDAQLLEKYLQLGPQWHKITSFFPGRAKNAVRNRIFALHHKKIRAPAWEAPRPAVNPAASPAAEQKTDDPSESEKESFPWDSTMDDNSIAWEFFYGI